MTRKVHIDRLDIRTRGVPPRSALQLAASLRSNLQRALATEVAAPSVETPGRTERLVLRPVRLTERSETSTARKIASAVGEGLARHLSNKEKR